MTAPFRTVRGKLRGQTPLNGRCECCGVRSGRRALKWHHCHQCGKFIAWLCNDCNLSLTEHAVEWWQQLWEIHDHPCHGQTSLFEPDVQRAPTPDIGNTARLHMSNGGGDDRYITSSKIDGHVTVEQMAAICGVNANTARAIVSGRNGQPPIGTKIGGTWFVSHDNMLAHLEKRWNQE